MLLGAHPLFLYRDVAAVGIAAAVGIDAVGDAVEAADKEAAAQPGPHTRTDPNPQLRNLVGTGDLAQVNRVALALAYEFEVTGSVFRAVTQ